MTQGVEWLGRQVLDEVQSRLRKNVTRACLHLRGVVVDSIGEPGPPTGPPSLKDDPPHKRTGTLRRSIDWEISGDGLKGRVGTNLKYGRWLEEGTRGGYWVIPGAKGFLTWLAPSGARVYTRLPVWIPQLKPRPFLRPALDKEQANLAKILAGGK